MRERTKDRWLPIAVAAMLVLGGSGVTADTATVSGQVEATRYDEDGNAVEVAINDSEWGSILVLEGGRGAELLDLVGAVVSATGDLREGDGDPHAYTIEVTDFTVEEPADPDGRDA